MNFLEAINHITPFLRRIGLQFVKSEDLGMHKYAKFYKDAYGIDFYYDRSGIELVATLNGQIIRDIIGIANWLNNGSIKYDYPSLSETNLEEQINYLSDVLKEEFELINHFLMNASNDDLTKYKMNQKFVGAQYWKKVFEEKSKPLPDRLLKIIKNSANQPNRSYTF